jgi:putative transposase
LQINRAAYRYSPADEDPLNETGRKEIIILAKRWRKYGTPRITWLLQEDGFTVNHKRVGRMYREKGLKLPGKWTKKKVKVTSWDRPHEATRRNEIWVMDFIVDKTKHGGQLKVLTVLEEGCRECLEIRAESRMTGRDILETLDELMQEYGKPKCIRSDNGSEFIAKELQEWLKSRGVDPVNLEPRTPWQNGFIESCNGKFRDECLEQELFLSKVEAQVVVEWWRQVYNWERLHRSLKVMSPTKARIARPALN